MSPCSAHDKVKKLTKKKNCFIKGILNFFKKKTKKKNIF